VGPLTWGGRPYFSWKKTGDLFLLITVRVSAVISPEKPATFFGHHCRFYSFHLFTRKSPIISATQKIAAALVGAPFCGGACSTEHAEHA